MKDTEDRIQSLEKKSLPKIISLPSLQTDIQPLISTPQLDQSPPPPAADLLLISTPASDSAPSLQESEESEVQYEVPSSPVRDREEASPVAPKPLRPFGLVAPASLLPHECSLSSFAAQTPMNLLALKVFDELFNRKLIWLVSRRPTCVSGEEKAKVFVKKIEALTSTSLENFEKKNMARPVFDPGGCYFNVSPLEVGESLSCIFYVYLLKHLGGCSVDRVFSYELAAGYVLEPTLGYGSLPILLRYLNDVFCWLNLKLEMVYSLKINIKMLSLLDWLFSSLWFQISFGAGQIFHRPKWILSLYSDEFESFNGSSMLFLSFSDHFSRALVCLDNHDDGITEAVGSQLESLFKEVFLLCGDIARSARLAILWHGHHILCWFKFRLEKNFGTPSFQLFEHAKYLYNCPTETVPIVCYEQLLLWRALVEWAEEPPEMNHAACEFMTLCSWHCVLESTISIESGFVGLPEQEMVNYFGVDEASTVMKENRVVAIKHATLGSILQAESGKQI